VSEQRHEQPAAMTHQDLFDGYVRAELSVIGEFSGNFVADWRDLADKLEPYAAEHGLNTDVLDEVRRDIEEAESA